MHHSGPDLTAANLKRMFLAQPGGTAISIVTVHRKANGLFLPIWAAAVMLVL